MKKRLIRCSVGWGVTNNGIHNIQVFYCKNGFGYHYELFICMNCGEIFIVDFENPYFCNKTIQEISYEQNCPICRSELSKSLQVYPATFRTEDGNIGHFIPERITENESVIKEFYEIEKINNPFCKEQPKGLCNEN